MFFSLSSSCTQQAVKQWLTEQLGLQVQSSPLSCLQVTDTTIVYWVTYQVFLPVPSGYVLLFVCLFFCFVNFWFTSKWKGQKCLKAACGWQWRCSCCHYCTGQYWGGMLAYAASLRHPTESLGSNTVLDLRMGKTNGCRLTGSAYQNMA